jgi:hypothetical protein
LLLSALGLGDSGDVVPTASVNQPLALLNCGDGPRVILHFVERFSVSRAYFTASSRNIAS